MSQRKETVRRLIKYDFINVKNKNFKNILDFFRTINYNIERRLTESIWRVVRAGRRSTIGNRVSR